MAQSPLDTRLASLGLLLGAGGIAYTYFKGRLGSGPLAGRSSTGAAPPEPGGGEGTMGTPMARLKAWADGLGLHITSGWRTAAEQKALGGSANSLHVLGRAIDVSVRGLTQERIQDIINNAHAHGFNAFFEGSGLTPHGPSTGRHIHVSLSPPGSHAK